MTPGPTVILRCPGCAAIAQCLTLASANMFGGVAWSDGRVEAPMWREEIIACRCPGCRCVFLRQSATELGTLPAMWMREAPTQRVVLERCSVAARVAVMRELRARLSLSLAEAKGVVDSLPAELAEALPHALAIPLCEALRAVGAVVSCEPIENDAPSDEPSPAEWVQAPAVEHPSETELFDFAESGELTSDEERLVRLVAWREGNDPFRRDGVHWISFSERSRAQQNLERLLDVLRASPDEQILRAEALRELGRFAESLAVAARLEGVPAAEEIGALAAAGIASLSVIAVAG